MIVGLIFSILLIFFCFNLYTNYYHHKWFFLSIMSAAMLSMVIYLYGNIFIALFFFYLLSSAAYTGIYTLGKHFAHPKFGVNVNLSYPAVQSYVAVFSLGFIFVAISGGYFVDLLTALKYLLGVNIFLTLLPKSWTEFKTHEKGRRAPICGFGANTSVNSTLLALMVPFAMVDFNANIQLNLALVIMTLIAIIRTMSSAGLGAYLVAVYIFFASYFNFMWQYFAIATLLGTIAVLIANFSQKRRAGGKSNIFDISGRDRILGFCRKYIWPSTNKMFGSGVGSLVYLMPEIQKSIKKQVPKERDMAQYIWLHCDAAQLIQECGIIGFILGAAVFVFAIYTCIITNNWVGLSFLGSYLVSSLVNFPHHLAPDAFIIIVMMRFIF